MGKISIKSENNPCLLDEIKQNIGKEILFSNGCSISLVNEDGYYWGSDPYGSDWVCNNDTWAVNIIFSWVSRWNQPRNETGRLMCD